MKSFAKVCVRGDVGPVLVMLALLFPVLRLTALTVVQTPVNPGKTVITYCCPECDSEEQNATPGDGIDAGNTGPDSAGRVVLRTQTSLPGPVFFSPQSLSVVLGGNGNVPGFVNFGPDQGGGSPPSVSFSEKCRIVNVEVTGDGSQVEVRKITCEGTSVDDGDTVIDNMGPGSGGAPGGGGSPVQVPTVNVNKADGTICRYAKTAGGANGHTWQAGELLQFTTPDGRTVNINQADLEIIRPEGVVRQVKTVAGLADVQFFANNNEGYVVNYYHAAQVGAKDGNGFYTFSGPPARSLEIKNLQRQRNQFNKFLMTKTEGTRALSSEYHYNDGNREWMRTLADGTRLVQRDTWPTTGVPPVQVEGAPAVSTSSIKYFFRTKERYDSVGTKVGMTHSVFWLTNDEEERILQEIKDFGGINYAKTFTYYTDANNKATYGKVRSVVESNGAWEYYVYDTHGRLIKNYRPWLDSVFPTTIPTDENGLRVTEYGYAAVASGDIVLLHEQRAHTIIERINGVETGRRYNAYFKDDTTGERRFVDERAVAQNDAFGTTGNLRTTTTYHADNAALASAGKVKTIQNPDATLTTYTYALDNNNSAAYLTTTQTQGAVASPSGVAYKSTQTVLTENKLGRLVQEETKVYTGGSNYSTLNIFQNIHNANGQVIQRKKDGRVLYDAEYTNGLLTREVDEVGIDTVYTHDEMGEVTSKLSRGITTTYNRTLGGIDCGCDGSVETTISAGGLTLTSRVEKDKLGRLIQTTDQAGMVTTYAYTNGGRTVTILKPNTAIEVRENFVDGQAKSTTGSGVVAQYHSYGINSNGTQWSKTNLVFPDGPRWDKNTSDFLGRGILNETPGFAGAVTSNTTVYNNLGQIFTQTKTTTSGSSSAPSATRTQTITYVYDSLGNIASTSTITTDATGQPSSPITQLTEQLYAQENNAWFAVSKQQLQYTENSQQQTITTSLAKQQLNGFVGDATAYLENFSSPFDATGSSINKTTQTRTINRTTKTVISTTTLPTSTQPSIQTTINGQLVSSISSTHGGTTLYQYDALGRQTGQKQPRHTNYSTITYNATGQLASTTDATGATTTYVYYANGVLGAGQLRQMTNALGHSTFREYDLFGRETFTWGPATYPVVQGYDAYGQRNLLRTFRDTNADFSTSLFPSTATGDTTTWTYDDATGALLQKTYADGKGPSYTYYADGLLKTRIWARKDANNNSLTTTYTYTSQGQLSSIDYSDLTPDVTYTYNTLGQQTTITDGTGTRNFTYDPTTQALTQEVYTGTLNATLHRAHDAYTRPTGYALIAPAPAGNDPWSTSLPPVITAATYMYDAQGNFYQVQGDTVPASLVAGVSTTNLTPNTFTYNRVVNSDLISSVVGPVHTVTNTYEPNRDVLASKQNRVTTGTQASSIVSQYDYTVNSIGQRTTRAQSGTAFGTRSRTDSFSYNTRGEVEISTNSPYPIDNGVYNYDPIGNRLSATEGTSIFRTYTSNALNQYTQINTTRYSVPTTAILTYDDDGNMLADGTGTTYTWDCESRLIQVRRASNELIKYAYDSGSRRIKREHIDAIDTKVTTYLYNGRNVLAEITTINPGAELPLVRSKCYTWGLDLSYSLQGSGGIGGLLRTRDTFAGIMELYHHTYDLNGNTSELLDFFGDTEAHYEYDAFGKEIVTVGVYARSNFYRFSTKPKDSQTELYYYGYRFYSPAIGRWMSRDPIGEISQINRYAFVKDTLKYLDVHGLFIKIIDGLHEKDSPIDPQTRAAWEKTKRDYDIRRDEFRKKLEEAIDKLKKCCAKHSKEIGDLGICQAINSDSQFNLVMRPPTSTTAERYEPEEVYYYDNWLYYGKYKAVIASLPHDRFDLGSEVYTEDPGGIIVSHQSFETLLAHEFQHYYDELNGKKEEPFSGDKAKRWPNAHERDAVEAENKIRCYCPDLSRGGRRDWYNQPRDENGKKLPVKKPLNLHPTDATRFF